jgi:hypothetical protein
MFSRSVSRGYSIYTVAFVVLIVLSLLWSFFFLTNDKNEDLTDFHGKYPRLDLYCAKTQALGAENSYFYDKEKFKLKNLVITIRHGDRSPIHIVPGSSAVEDPVSSLAKASLLLDKDVIEHTPHLSSLLLNPLGKPLEKIVSVFLSLSIISFLPYLLSFLV